MGPAAAELLAQAALPTPEAETFAVKDSVVVLNQQALDVPGYEIIAPADDAATLLARFEATGAVPVDADTYNVHRIELGRPGAGVELVEAYNPLEAGLAWTCADNKGCYTGQEIIARQITYDKITKSLVTLSSDELLAPGTELTAAGRTVGEVTSAAYSPRAEAPIAHAVVKRPQNVAGTVLDAGGQRVVVKE
jgi:folate-binding protein YgfZ